MSGKIRGEQIRDNSITGDDVDESTLIITELKDADGDTKVQIEESADEDKIRFDTAGIERMVINDSGQVGIGTDDPDNTLHISSKGHTHLKIQSEAGSYAAVKMKSGTGGSTYVWTPADTSDIRLYAGGDDRVHVDNTGNVGIGTLIPSSTLQINGSVSKAIATKTANYGATGDDSTILIDASSSSVTITLPAVGDTTGRIYTIKCIGKGVGQAANVATNGSEEIDGSRSDVVLNVNQSLMIQSSGDAWYKIAEFIGPPPP